MISYQSLLLSTVVLNDICMYIHYIYIHVCMYVLYIYTCMYVTLILPTYVYTQCYTYVYICTYVGAPIIGMITVTEGCSYLYVSWMYNNNACGNVMYTVTTRYTRIYTTRNSFNFTGLPYSTLFNVIIEGSNRIGSDSNSTLASTLMLESQYIYNFTYIHAYTYVHMY